MSTINIKLLRKFRTFVDKSNPYGFTGLCTSVLQAYALEKISTEERESLKQMLKKFKPANDYASYYFPKGQKAIRLRYLDLIIEWYSTPNEIEKDAVRAMINNLNKTFYAL
ncbi:hypothetical protein [Elizabethkingia phage TCUEAP1]|nr:hypothetical protein [Elizabethkingia phage TCUEAP1]